MTKIGSMALALLCTATMAHAQQPLTLVEATARALSRNPDIRIARDDVEAAGARELSASGSYGPQLVLTSPNQLPSSVLNFFLDYATPGYTQEGPTAAVYNHAWLIGDPSTISVSVQAEVDSLLEVVPQK